MNRMKPYLDGGMPFDVGDFKNVPIELAPIYGWNFNDHLDKATIKKQIDDMERAGIRSVYVLPEPKNFRPTTIPTMLEPDYLTDEFMEYIAFTVDYAKSKGMLMWLYDEGGWPSGSACGEVYRRDKSTAKKHLGEVKRMVKVGECYVIPNDVVAVFKDGKRLTADFTADTDATVTEYRLIDDSVMYGGGGNRKTPYKSVVAFEGCTDIMEPRTVELFLETTHERYREYCGDDFGSHITMMFTDEPRPGRPAWFSGIEKQFYDRFGYDILDHLPALFTDGDGADVRVDYNSLCGDVLRKVYFDRIREWCHANDLLFCGHLDQDNLTDGGAIMNYGSSLDLLRGMDVPGVDVIWRQIFPFADGRRVEKGCPFFPRMASSAASQSGGNLALTESFGVYGLGLTMAQMRYVFGYQAIRGVNLMNPLLVSYGTREHFGFGERPYFNAEIPGHDDLPLINRCFERMSYLAAVGRRNVRCALYISTDDINAGGKRRAEFVRNFDALGVEMEKSGIDFDIIDAKGILEGSVSDGVLHIGAAAYDSIIVPNGATVDETVGSVISALNGTPKPLMKCDVGFDDLRVSSRVFDDGDMLYLLFNEANDILDATVEIADGRPSYLLDPTSGRAFDSDAAVTDDVSKIKIRLESGEMVGVLFTDKSVDVGGRTEYHRTIDLTDFEVRAVRKFVIDASGFYDVTLDEDFRKFPLGEWSGAFGRDFSGEVEYRTTVELDDIVGKSAKLSLGKLCYSASLSVNGEFVGCAGLTPCEVEFPCDLLKVGRNEIVIKVANTAANQMLYSDAEDNWTASQLTPYNDKAREFEADSLESGLFGPVQLMTE